MSSINLFPTFNYSQPTDYHFSHDSVFLARQIFEKHQQELCDDYRILDLCAGVGVVGLDFLFHCLKENKNEHLHFDFLEVQNIYQNHFFKNVEALKNNFSEVKAETNWIIGNYNQFHPHQQYDLILSNPPYFLQNQGKLSPNQFKNRCRFFLDATWVELLTALQRCLKPNGQAYFLVRDDLKEVIQKQGYENITFDLQIRGTWVGHLKMPKA